MRQWANKLGEQRCPCCGRALPEVRLGVELTPLKARIFDLIARSGVDGIAAEDLAELAYSPGVVISHASRERRQPRAAVRSHVAQINDALEDTGHRIVCIEHIPPFRYRLNGGAS